MRNNTFVFVMLVITIYFIFIKPGALNEPMGINATNETNIPKPVITSQKVHVEESEDNSSWIWISAAFCIFFVVYHTYSRRGGKKSFGELTETKTPKKTKNARKSVLTIIWEWWLNKFLKKK